MFLDSPALFCWRALRSGLSASSATSTKFSYYNDRAGRRSESSAAESKFL